MSQPSYLIIGGGMTAAAAAVGIRELDSDGTITMISAETAPPYDRPPLSKKLWSGKRTLEQIVAPLPADVELHLDRRVVAIDPDNRQATDDAGVVYTYDKLLLATGGAPRHLPFGGDAINYYRTVEDYRTLRAEAGHGDSFVVIGGGFIGSEIAAALRSQGNDVTIIFPEDGIGNRLFPPGMPATINEMYRKHGVTVLSDASVVGVEKEGDRTVVITGDGQRLSAGRVVAGIGIIPSVELAKAMGLAVDNGVTVDEYLRTARPEIYAAGDVANYPDLILGIHRRVEHADAARAMGRAAGRNMAGANEPYRYLPLFYSDLFELGYEAVGQCDPRLEMVEDWQDVYSRGVVYYLKDGRVCGVLLVDVWDKVDEARALIEKGEKVDPKELINRIN
ncbi:MAG TPA: FAD-dependent oxidoreductase [Promineifilum sp.]|nr:FAD-dependent oxidoreductase [Promineifilum sp.]